MAELVAQTYASGEDVTLAAAAVAGDSVPYGRNQKLMVFNGSLTEVTVTVASAAPTAPPVGPANLEVPIAAGKYNFIDISDRNYNNAGSVAWTYSAETDVEVAVISGI